MCRVARCFRVSFSQGWILDIDREKVLLEMMHVTCIYTIVPSKLV